MFEIIKKFEEIAAQGREIAYYCKAKENIIKKYGFANNTPCFLCPFNLRKINNIEIKRKNGNSFRCLAHHYEYDYIISILKKIGLQIISFMSQ